MRRPLMFALLLALPAAAFVVFRGYRRWEVTGRSMMPALEPGDCLLVEPVLPGSRPVRPGEIVLAPDPRDPRRTLIKRVARIDEGGLAWLEGDNPAESTDSREFGPVALEEITARVRWRYWPLARMGRVP